MITNCDAKIMDYGTFSQFGEQLLANYLTLAELLMVENAASRHSQHFLDRDCKILLVEYIILIGIKQLKSHGSFEQLDKQGEICIVSSLSLLKTFCEYYFEYSKFLLASMLGRNKRMSSQMSGLSRVRLFFFNMKRSLHRIKKRQHCSENGKRYRSDCFAISLMKMLIFRRTIYKICLAEVGL